MIFDSREGMVEYILGKLEKRERIRIKMFDGKHYRGSVKNVGWENIVIISDESIDSLNIDKIAEVD